MYNSFRPEDKRSSDNFDIINILSNRDESFTCRTIVNGLFDAIKDPNLPKEEREKAGELLAKIYNNSEIPQGVKNEIHEQIQTMAHEACVATISARLGLPKEVVQEMVPQNGIVSIAMMANYKTEIVDRNDFGKNITTRRPYNESEIAGINEHYTLTPGNKIGHSEMQVEFFYGEPKDKPGLKPEDNPVPPILYIPIQESVKDFEGEMIEIRNGFPNASFEEKNNILSKVLSLSERDFDSAISVSNSLKLLDVHALGFSAGVVRSTSEFSKNEDLKQEVKKVLKDEVEKIVQEYNKNPDSNALSEEQKNNIVKAWSVAMGGQKTFEEIAVEIANK
jgi:cation transport regulator ChaB